MWHCRSGEVWGELCGEVYGEFKHGLSLAHVALCSGEVCGELCGEVKLGRTHVILSSTHVE